MTQLTLRLFGTFQATLDGEAITGFESSKVRALLAYLAVEAGEHSRDALVGLLWPEWPNRDALSNLRYALYNLRNALGDRKVEPPFLLITRRTLQFNRESDYRLDVERFETYLRLPTKTPLNDTQACRLQSAVELYQGALLAEFSLADCPAFEEWALLKREYFDRKLVTALQCLATYYEQAGEYEQAQFYVRQQLAREPWDERAHRRLMRLLARTGRRNAALVQYETCRRCLDEELGVAPLPATTALYKWLKAGNAPLPKRVAAAPPAAEKPVPAREAFVAREREVAHLNAHLASALAGEGRVVFVTGEAGSGKSTLIHAFARQAMRVHSGLLVACGSSSAQAGFGDLYLPFREVLQMLAGDVEARRASGTLTREHIERLWNALPDAARVLVEQGPDLVGRFVPGEALALRVAAFARNQGTWYSRLQELAQREIASPMGEAVCPVALCEQVTRVLQGLSRCYPLLLMLDDLQWADRGSSNLLFHLGRRLAGTRLLVVGAYRPGELSPHHPLRSVVHELQRRMGEILIDLDQVEGQGFVDAFLDSEPNRLDATFRATLCRHTGGNPLFTVELLRGMQERGELRRDARGRWGAGAQLTWERLPARVEAVIAERLSRLPLQSRAILQVASVEGEVFTAEVVARVLGSKEETVIRHLSGTLGQQCRLVRAHSVQRSGGLRLSRYRFRHHLFREYLYHSLDKVERARWHQGVGEALAALYANDVGHAGQIAQHFEAAGSLEQAVNYLLQAGEHATALAANSEVLALFSRAQVASSSKS